MVRSRGLCFYCYWFEKLRGNSSYCHRFKREIHACDGCPFFVPAREKGTYYFIERKYFKVKESARRFPRAAATSLG